MFAFEAFILLLFFIFPKAQPFSCLLLDYFFLIIFYLLPCLIMFPIFLVTILGFTIYILTNYSLLSNNTISCNNLLTVHFCFISQILYVIVIRFLFYICYKLLQHVFFFLFTYTGMF